MKIAVPIKTRKDSPVSPLFGKAKWFAFIDGDDNIEIKQNNCHGGGEVIQWLIDEKVNTIIFQEMGTNPYNLLKQYDEIVLFHSGYERTLLHDVLDKLKNNQLIMIDDTNIDDIIKNHEIKHLNKN